MSAFDRWVTRLVTGRGAFAVALTFAAILTSAGVFSHSLWTPDEPTGSAVGRAMYETGDYVVPRLNGQPFLEKPPLYWWVQAAAFRTFGVNDAAARVPSVLFSLLTIAATFGLARRLAGPRAGVVAVAVLATTAEFNEDMARVVVDPALTCFVTVAYWGFAVLAEARSTREGRIATAAIALAIPLAFLTKGVVAIGLGVVPPVTYLLWRARTDVRLVTRLWLLALMGTLAFAVLVVPWAALLVQRAGWTALRECLVGNTLGRFLTTESSRAYGHRQPVWYYAVNGVAVTLPWILTLPAMLRAGVWRQGSGSSRLLVACGAIGVLLLSLAGSKRTLYLMPLLPAFAACVGWWAQHITDAFDPDAPVRAGNWDRATLDALAIVAGVVPLALFAAAIVIRTPAWWPATAYPLARVAADLTAGRLAVLALAAGVAAAGLAARFSSRARLASPPAIGGILVSYGLLFFAYQTAGKALVDPVKNLHDLTAAIGRQSPAGSPVLAFRPIESLQAIVNFDLGRRVEAVDSPQSVADLFARNPSARLVVAAEAIHEWPPDLAAHCRFTYNETGRKALPYAIVVCTP